MLVSMCHGNCSACKIKRTVDVNKAVRQTVELRMVNAVEEVSVETSVEVAPQTTEEPIVAEETAIPKEIVEENVQTGLALYEPSEQVETYKIAKTRKGFIGKLVGGLA